jgi:pimeloyl-ACP methyl ester carboxylesterase
MNFGPPPAVEVSSTELGPDRIPADVYRAPGGRSRGTILSVHGATLFGYRDPRIVNLCTVLSVSGHTIVNPHYAEIADLRMEAASLDHFMATVRAVTADPHLRPPSGRIGVLAHSFSAGIALSALACPEAEERVNVICSVGGAYNFETAVASLMGQQDQNHYPRRMVLWNFLHHSTGSRSGLDRALRAGLEDNGYERQEPHLPEILAGLDKEERELFLQLQDDPEVRLEHLERFRPVMEPIVRAMSRIEEVRIPVILVHGLTDTVLPASQARELYSQLRRRGTPVWLDISPLLDHNRAYIGIRMIVPLVRLLNTFARFFRLAAG